MRLSDLASGFVIVPAGADPEVTGITEDSRQISPGMLFVAVPGTALDGHAYISQAVARGASAVVAQRTGAVPVGVPAVRVSSSRAALAELAARFYGSPHTALTLIGFTGTFGKTSTSEILRSLLAAAGVHAGVVGSLGARFAGYTEPGSGLTTPAPVELHRMLRRLSDAGARSVILEVTSHALRLGRLTGLRFGGGLLAAIMPGEHTDFHRSYDDYLAAKRLFLDYLGADALLAYDADNPAARRLAAEATKVARAAGFSVSGRQAELQVYDVLIDAHGATFSIGGQVLRGESGARVHSALLGRGHLRNVALALTYALGAGVGVDTARDVLAALTPVRRRMERYDAGARIVLDDTAAHPDSLRATFGVAALLPHESATVVYAMRGNRGADINRRNALALADLVSLHGAGSLVVTASAECTGPADQATSSEIDATRQALVARGRRFVWHDTLDAALREALERTRPGDLIVLLGAQGMNQGRGILERLVTTTPSARGELDG